MVRGSDKSSSIARVCNWCLAFSPTYLKITVGAADIDQAKIVRNAMLDEARLNPWFANLIKIDQYKASGQGGELEIIPAEASGAYGKTSDIYICDELTHWGKEDFWTSLYSGRHKRKGCLFFILTNAGYEDTWQRKLFFHLQTDPSWKIQEAPGIQASWVDRNQIDIDRRAMPETEARRLFDNQWVPAGGNVVFPHADITRLFQKGIHPTLELSRWSA